MTKQHWIGMLIITINGVLLLAHMNDFLVLTKQVGWVLLVTMFVAAYLIGCNKVKNSSRKLEFDNPNKSTANKAVDER